MALYCINIPDSVSDAVDILFKKEKKKLLDFFSICFYKRRKSSLEAKDQQS